MEKGQALATLAALAQDSRLDVFLLVARAGPEGLSAGCVAAALGLAPNTLTFHFDRLRRAKLLRARRAGRSIMYATRRGRVDSLVDYLNEYCCGANPALQTSGAGKEKSTQAMMFA
jgi:ArsR family transcriptional regulator